MTRHLTFALSIAVFLALAPAANATGRLTCETIEPDAWLREACFHPASGKKLLVLERFRF